MQISFMIMGMFLDDLAIIMILTPIYLPIVMNYGFNPLWFGILFMINVQIAWLSPPYGFSIFVMRSAVRNVEGFEDITIGLLYRAVLPFIVCQLIIIALVMIFPQFALWLPSLVITK